MSTEELLLEKMKFAVSHAVSKKAPIGEPVIDVYVNHIADSLVVRLSTYIAASKRVVRYPATWWDAFKEQYFHGRVKRWFPVKYKEVQVAALFPDLRLQNNVGKILYWSE